MKNFILFLLFAGTLALSGADMAAPLAGGKGWQIRGKNFSCVFPAGKMFPEKFIVEGKEFPIRNFYDSIQESDTKKEYLLRLCSDAKTVLVKNTPKECIIEITGSALERKTAKKLPFVTIAYRYRFTCDRSGFTVTAEFAKDEEEQQELKIVQSFSMVLKEACFDSIRKLPAGKTEKTAMKYYDFHARENNGALLTGKDFTVTVKAPRVIVGITKYDWYKTGINAGAWGTKWTDTVQQYSADFEIRKTTSDK